MLAVRVPYCQLVTRILLNVVQILSRGFVLALLASYLHYYTVLLVLLMVIANYTAAHFIVQTEPRQQRHKHRWPENFNAKYTFLFIKSFGLLFGFRC